MARQRYIVTTQRITREQYDWLRQKAFAAALEKGGRPDASALLRKILDKAMRNERKAAAQKAARMTAVEA